MYIASWYEVLVWKLVSGIFLSPPEFCETPEGLGGSLRNVNNSLQHLTSRSRS